MGGGVDAAAKAKAKAQLSALSSLPPCDLDLLSTPSPAHYQGPAPFRSQGSKATPLNFITKDVPKNWFLIGHLSPPFGNTGSKHFCLS